MRLMFFFRYHDTCDTRSCAKTWEIRQVQSEEAEKEKDVVER